MTIDIDIFFFYIVIFIFRSPVSIIFSTFDFSLCFFEAQAP